MRVQAGEGGLLRQPPLELGQSMTHNQLLDKMLQPAPLKADREASGAQLESSLEWRTLPTGAPSSGTQ